MKKNVSISLLVIAILLSVASSALSGATADDMRSFLIRNIPLRPALSLSGSQFVRSILGLDAGQREQAIRRQLILGNLPDFLRELKAVRFSRRSPDGRRSQLTLFAMPDYLAIGSNDDFLLIPMTLTSALEIADRYGFTLPSRKIVDVIFGQSPFHLKPQPLPAGPRMSSTAYYQRHNDMISRQRLALCCPPGELIAGHKKDIVMSSRLFGRAGKIAIYGWHKPSGRPIQPLTTVHGKNYTDYSHGVRLIGETVILDGEPRSLYEIIENRELASLVSDEGPLAHARRFMTGAGPDRSEPSTGRAP